jgi:hypothetical protein
MLAARGEGFAETTLSELLGDTQRQPYVLILLGGVLIAGAIGLRHLIIRKRKNSPL